MSDNEVEKFEITDYDLEHEFSQNRPGRRQTKEQQIYGMWAQESGGEDEGEGDPGSSIPPPSRLSVLRGGLNFVSGGIQQAGKKADAKAKADGSDDNESESELTSRPMFGVGGAADSSDEDIPRQLPASFGNKKSSSQPSFTSSKRQDIAGMRKGGGMRSSGGGSSLLGSGLGDWEKYTSGIGSKLLKKMGFEEGKGLGKNLQGISTPVEANKRKGKGAIGFYGSERSERSLKDFPTHDSDEEDKEKFKDLLQQWKKTGSKKKIKYIYKSAEEVIQEGRTKKIKPTDDSHITKTKVIDMTGPETRVLSSYHAIAGQKNFVDEYEEDKKKKYEHFDLPELLHNLQILLEKCEDDIIRNARTVERESDRVVHLSHEREKYEALVEREKKELDGLDQALALVESLETRHKEQTLTLTEATSIFNELKSDYQKIYNTFEIPYLAPTYITPLLKELLRTWNPLAQPASHKEVFATWQKLVEVGDDQQQQQQPDGTVPLDPYHHLVWETWASAVRSAIMGPWEPRDCSPLLAVLEAWNVPLVPMWIQAHLLQHVILPRITRAVQNWNPLQDTVPIHTWLHPWLPLLVDNLQSVYPVIRQKLSAALIHWHPNDRSAKMVLQPWKRVFSDISMTTLLQTNIQPKLESALLEMAITPHNQNLDPWHWFLDWDDLLPPQISLDIMERCFFPQWYQALGAWLSTNPPHQEVIAWYKGWRDLIPKSLSNHLQVRQKFQQALDVCSRALSYQPGASDQFNLLLAGLDKLNEPPPPPPLGSPPQQRSKDWADIISSARRETLSMREVVERRCQERGIVFVPLPDRKHEARPVYRCGKLNVSFNKNIIYVQTERGWMPKSLTTLLDDA